MFEAVPQNIVGNTKTKWFYGVDSIRFVLAFIVMLSHFDNVYATALKHSAHSIFRDAGYFLANAFDGTSAVIAFFIISGFVIHYPNKNGIPNLTEFWIRRFLRILIPLAVILIIGTQFNHPENAVVWSLFCELIYYGLYPFMAKIKLSWKSKFLISYAIAAIVIGTLCFHDVLAFVRQTNTNYQGYYWQLGGWLTWIVGLPCWLLGVLIAEHIDDLKQASFKSVMTYRIIVFFISFFCCLGKFHLHISYILSMNIFALLIYKWLQTEIVYFKTHPSNKTLEKMGKFSYSLYLCHPLLYVVLRLLLVYNTFTYPLFLLLAVAISYGFYLVVEKPGHQLARKINSKYNTTLN
ncbi:MAG TPA: acyltransferase family protein [Mucilaginibacter sp.]|jgi:peptidoglycan/LPS O-acetylase OafA/YrhL|nr:acyltransferase family protein [Mucilaginibacter sp.]